MSSRTDPSDRRYLLFAFRIVGDLGATIAIPAAFGALLGQKLDETYDTGLRYTAIGLGVAAILTAIMLYQKVKKYSKEYEEINKKD